MLRDEFFWLNRISEATVVVGLANGQFQAGLARRALEGIRALEADADAGTVPRVTRYIDWEPLLIERVGPTVSVIHAGRSSQDILATLRTALFRDKTLDVLGSFDTVLTHLLQLAREHAHTIVPSYTNGVAAQPTAWGHTLSALAASLLRYRTLLSDALHEFDRSSMGAMVLNGTGWPLDRDAMAKTLGFLAPVRNAFDATCYTPVDFPLTIALLLAPIGARLGTFLNDVMVQYAQPRPWFLLKEGGANTYISSAMPQKRNPGLINNAREDASDLVGEANTLLMRVHNVNSGMTDGKSVLRNRALLATAAQCFDRFDKVLTALVVNPERALEELNSDWTASQEIADTLMREHGLPFRIGHHMASRVVSVAKREGFTPLTFPYERAVALYDEEIRANFPDGDPHFPMTQAAWEETLHPERIVARRKTAGSANPEEVLTMVDELEATLTTLNTRDAQLIAVRETALDELKHAVEVLLSSPTFED